MCRRFAQNIRFMNREVKDWKCPDCDTINIGRRCVICGKEKPEAKKVVKTPAEPAGNGKSLKEKIIIYICSVIVFLAVSFLVVKVIVDHNAEERTIKVTVKDDKPKKEEKPDTIRDDIYKNTFSIEVSIDDIEEEPKLLEIASDTMEYVVPESFEQTPNYDWLAGDETAYMKIMERKVGENKTVSSLMEDAQIRFNDNIIYEEEDERGYIFCAETEDVKYYYCEKLQSGQVIGFVFAFPKIYEDVYDEYADILAENLTFAVEEIYIP